MLIQGDEYEGEDVDQREMHVEEQPLPLPQADPHRGPLPLMATGPPGDDGADAADEDPEYMALKAIVRDRERRAERERKQTERMAARIRQRECFLCHYGATSWSVGEHGVALFHDLERIVSIRHAQVGSERTAYLAVRFHEERMKPLWARVSATLPPMDFATTVEHLSGNPVVHTLNPRLALSNCIRDEMNMLADMKDHYRKRSGDMDTNVLREIRMHGQFMFRFAPLARRGGLTEHMAC